MTTSQRKRELLDAAVRVASRSDENTLSVRSVAEEAGVSPGSVIYHFGDMDALVTNALIDVIEQLAARRREQIADVSDPVDRIRLLIETGVPDTVDGSLRFIYEHIDHARTHPGATSLHRSVVERQVDIYESTIDLGAITGAFRPTLPSRMIATTLVALEDGFDLWALIGFQDRVRLHRETMRRVASQLLDAEV